MSWPQLEIKEVARVVGGATPSSGEATYWDGDIDWATPKDLSDLNSKIIDGTPRKITQAGLRSCSAERLPVGSVLFSSRAPIGHIAINSTPMATNQGFKSFIPGPDLDASFLYWWLDANRERLQAMGNGATFKEVSKAVVEGIVVPVPPMPEQRRIAAILDQADALRRMRRQALSRLSDLEAAMFFDTFVSGAKSDWRETNVADLVDKNNGGIRTGPFGSQLLHSEFVDEGIAVLGIDNAVSNNFRWAKQRYITPQKYADLTRYKVHPGDVLITIMGTCGRCAIVPDGVGEAINTKHLCCISLDQDRCLPEFLHAYFLRHPTARHYLTSRSKGAIMDGLNMGIIKELPVVLPPLSTQRKFKRSLAALGGPASRAEMALADVESLFTSLQYRAFRGEL
ncbi:hypothetical protein CG471_07045 [Sphingobium sp. IP1]|uniref:restriction endonuclease subunit S n=1 Tax=Sphingobium sp. IP1 TaxID=2021637 RepID=UPI000C073BE8|nr:restriction endonuclease subunit S [Sphingobium sp. IP1]PHP20465.1 hypothetical protein CG471_07045 [Sphingobium sp. IP1]